MQSKKDDCGDGDGDRSGLDGHAIETKAGQQRVDPQEEKG